jgi:hypothetical protein
VPVALVAFPVRLMQGYVHRAAVLGDQAAGEPDRQIPLCVHGKLHRQRHFPLPCRPRVLLFLGSLGSVPQSGSGPDARAFWHHELGMQHARAARVIMLKALPLVAQASAGAIGCRRHGAAAGGTAA